MRKKLQIKQLQLAKQLGISRSYMSMILSGQRRCPERLVHKLNQFRLQNRLTACLEGRNSTPELLPQSLR